MGSFVVVSPEPACRVILHFSDTVKQILTEPVVTDRAVVTLDVGILLRVARLDKTQFNTTIFSPCRQYSTDVFRPIVPKALRGAGSHSEFVGACLSTQLFDPVLASPSQQAKKSRHRWLSPHD